MEFLVVDFERGDAQFVADHSKVKIPPIEVRCRKLILDDSNEKPILPPFSMMEPEAVREENKKGRRLVKMEEVKTANDHFQKHATPRHAKKSTGSSTHPHAAAGAARKSSGQSRLGKKKGN
ncbi:unnamed protein product [Linum trigynum]|uniref:Uncharacterized protein n=1 Tax=Linum trigynum TaxID=586398 RepID=A0AAV2CWL0_9ROSI